MKEFNNEMNSFIVNHRQVSRSWYKLTDEFNRSFGTHYSWEKIRSHYRRNLESEVKEMQQDTSVTLKENGEQISQIKIAMTREQSKDPGYLLEAHGYDPKQWKVKSAVSNIWDGQTAGGPQIMYQSKITVAPRKPNEINVNELIEAIAAETRPVAIDYYEEKNTIANTGLIINLSDLHFGILEYNEELHNMQTKIVNTIIMEKPTDVHINLLGDIFHSDSMVLGTTTKGTRVDDIDMVKAIEDAKEFLESIIYMAYHCAEHVRINMVVGNHDLSISYVFGQYLKARFQDTSIKFNVKLQHRFACRVNDNIMMCLAHGDLGRRNLPMIFATEYPGIWGTTKERICFTGHLHHQKKEVTSPVDDKDGMTIYQQPTIKPNDYYEIKNGYVTSKKMIQLYSYDEKHITKIHHLYK